jgi:signal transduction histidine kinase
LPAQENYVESHKITNQAGLTMRLSEFISRDMQAILTIWDTFAAAQLPAAANMDAAALRDHAEEILHAVVKDLQTSQTPAEQIRKSQGLAPTIANAPETAAETHAFLRAKSGFDINQMAAEYRALRASVLHLWARACDPDATNVEDMVRFNEAIDQAIAESVAFFGAKMTEDRNLLLGMLGHDMRGPLHVIQMTASLLGKTDAGDRIATMAARIASSGAQLKALLDDLIDFNRTNLGLGIHIAPVRMDLAELFSDALEQLRTGHLGRVIDLQITGDAQGVWDAHRMHQLLSNLVINALKYGDQRSSVKVTIVGIPTEVEFSVINRGRRIEQSVLNHIFDPLVRGSALRNGTGGDGSLGLGLYIAGQIALAHAGDINVRSDDSETVFTVRLPRLSSKAGPSAS